MINLFEVTLPLMSLSHIVFFRFNCSEEQAEACLALLRPCYVGLALGLLHLAAPNQWLNQLLFRLSKQKLAPSYWEAQDGFYHDYMRSNPATARREKVRYRFKFQSQLAERNSVI